MPARELLIAKAESQMAKWPQYKGHFDDYVLVKIKKNVKTKLGMAFIKGEVTIAKPETRIEGTVKYRVVYSFTNQADTLIKEQGVEVIA